jgi:hypothetical protein
LRQGNGIYFLSVKVIILAHFFALGRAKKPGQKNARESAACNPRPYGPAHMVAAFVPVVLQVAFRQPVRRSAVACFASPAIALPPLFRQAGLIPKTRSLTSRESLWGGC